MFRVKYRLLVVLALGVYSYLNILYTTGTSLFGLEISHLHLFVILTVVVLGIWELNRLADIYAIHSKAAVKARIHPLIILFLISLANVVIASFAGIQLVMLLGIDTELNINHFKLLMAFGFRVNLFLACVNAIVFFMNRLKQTQVEAEQFKKISVEAQFEALRAQINPHFLFNCFNVLSSLVYKDADTSARFIGQLSNVYRYLIYNQDRKIISLQEELDFLQSYLYLIQIRFADNINVSIELKDQSNYHVAPAVLQMLIENAIKHNVVSRKNPLFIHLYMEDNYLVVSNTLQEKEVKEESTRIGLRNISERYRFLSDHEVKVEKTQTHFKVYLPLLNVSR